MKKTLLAIVLLLTAPVSWAGQVDVIGVRMWPAPDNTRLVFDLSGPIEHTLFSLKNPDRIVVDLQNSRLRGDLPAPEGKDNPIKSLRSGTRNQQDLRIVLDADQRLRPKSFVLKPYGDHGHRLVLDLEHDQQERVVAKSSRTPNAGNSKKLRDVVIAIDAGHGGEDPGARGYRGTQEKRVVLAVARKLEALVKREPGMRAVMIRDGDYFIRLRDRINKARQARADIFISIHADAFHNPKASGSSVYTLSRRGATSEAARFLAVSENNSDRIGGVRLDDKDDLLASVLLDLSQTASLEASMDVASNILGGLKQLGKTHKRSVQSANFLVLKSPDIPSVLVETAFISNPEEERKLRTAAYQQHLAGAMMKGIRNYFERFPPPGTRLARRHTIQRGETLSGIAERYQVNMQALRATNKLNTDRIHVGQTLRIPTQTSDS
ncbi:N-acetylmuramoyl-L-alanine amidase [Sulfuriflexus sp.]|uniref:N-acetylmuramoyl-L-alanine amidase n=1 Tax=Sulfuriflexus sp. TaxID=2015443 RepID=UPI0028CDD0B0|nr:N-acetylmuramoyl-L-alanine amidase [Sulfuriflexus sp.]MDT8404891.1 N-acetylmuramoyl-L-alanine amidase [Sulfuriflexus sp.]